MNPGYYKFIDRRWFETGKTLALFGLIAVVALQPVWLAQIHKQRERIVIQNGPGSYTVAPALTFDEATDLHEDCAFQAARAAFDRDSSGARRKLEIDRWFLTDAKSGGEAPGGARGKIERLIESEAPELTKKSAFQTMNLTQPSQIVILSDKAVSVTLRGQIIRYGVFQGRSLVEPRDFSVQFTLVRNPNMMLNNRPPLAVWDFDYKIQ